MFIKFLVNVEVTLAIRRMKSIAGLPNIIGAIDGSHVQIKGPKTYTRIILIKNKTTP